MKRAVIIGVDEYRDNRIPDLAGARNDAGEMRELLVRSGEFHVDPPLIGKAATGEAIRRAVSDLLWNTDEIDLALLYFSGHAYDDTYGNGFLAPYDMDYERPFVHGLRMQELNDLMRRAVNKDVILLVLDACKSGIAASGERGAAQPAPFEEAFKSLEQEDHEESKGRIVLASSGADEKSHERANCQHQALAGDPHPHGAFTFHVLEALSGLAASDGQNVTLHDIHSYVERELQGQTVTFFGSGLQMYKQIRLVEAGAFVAISGRMDRAEEFLKGSDAMSLFRAMGALLEIRRQTRGNDRAIVLRRNIDDRLSEEREVVTVFLTDNMWDLVTDCPQTSRRIQELVSDISFDALPEADRKLVGLLPGLWQAAKSGDPKDYKTWLNTMKSFEKHNSEALQVAESKNQALKLER